MKYLFDTDTLSELLRRAPSTTLLRRMAATPVDDQATSSITAGELWYGAYRVRDHAADLAGRIERTLQPNLPVLAFDIDAAKIYGGLRADLERAGTPIGDADMRIAAIALAHELTVVTGNVRHFERVRDLPVENWLV